MYRTVVGTLMLAASVAHAGAPSAPTVTYEAVTATAPVGISRLRVTPVGSRDYAIDFSIVAPNSTQHVGHIQGLATQDGMRLTLRVPIFRESGHLDHPSLCTLVIEADDARARVVSAHQCSAFHGAAAGFVEQGQHLVRVH